MGIGFTEGLLIFLIVVLLFGSKKIPEVGKMLGASMKSFKEGLNEGSKNNDSKNAKKDDNGPEKLS